MTTRRRKKYGRRSRELLKKIIEMFETGKPPLPIEETVEIIAFLEAALKSANSGGTEERLII